jgi:hypothetical protein
VTDGTDAAPPPPPPPPPPGDAPPTTTAPGGPTGPGWHPDPSGRPGLQRYWDGTKWTDHTHSTSPIAGQQAPRIKLPLSFRIMSWGCLGMMVVGVVVLIAIFSFTQSLLHGLSGDLTGPKPNLNEDITHSPGPRPSGLADPATGLSFPFPDKRWQGHTLQGPQNAAVAADPWDCGPLAHCYHGLLVSGGPVTGTDLATFAQQKGEDLHPRYIGKVQTETPLVSAALTVAGHPAWQMRWKIVSSEQGTPPATAWLLAVDTGVKGTGGVGEEYDWLYGAVDDNDPNLSPSVFDQVLKNIQIHSR